MPEIHRPTKCKLCNRVFKSDSLRSAILVGANPQAKMQHIQALVSPLMEHLQKKHPQELQWSQMCGGEYGGMLALNFFDCTEETFEEMRDRTRWRIHQLTQRVKITDERIRERLELAVMTTTQKELPQLPKAALEVEARSFSESKLGKEILATMCQMRDVIQELGRYQDQPEPPAAEPDTPSPASILAE